MNLSMVSLRLRDARMNKNLSQEQLASLMNVSRATIQSYEKGKTMPKMQVLKDLAALLDCDVKWLMGEEFEGDDLKPKSIPGGMTEQLKKMHNDANMMIRREKTLDVSAPPKAMIQAWKDLELDEDYDDDGVANSGGLLEKEYLEMLKEGRRIHFFPPRLPTLDPELFWELWMTYVNEDIAHRGWAQVELVRRFPEFVRWLKLYFKRLDESESATK